MPDPSQDTSQKIEGPMEPAAAPQRYYVRCEEASSHADVYVKKADLFNGYPQWGSTTHAMCSVGSGKSVRWQLGDFFSEPHRGELPHKMVQWTDGFGGSAVSGLAIGLAPNPKLQHVWADSLWKLKRLAEAFVYVNRRDEFVDNVEKIATQVANPFRDYASKNSALQTKLQTCTAGCMAACFPDLELVVADGTRIPARRKSLMAASPFFHAMLKEGGGMKEATARCVELPCTKVSVARSVLCLIYTDMAALPDLQLSVSDLVEVLAQEKMGSAGLSDMQALLKLVSLHAAADKGEWSKTQVHVVKGFARLAGEDPACLEDLPFEVLAQVLQCDELCAAGREGRILVLVTKWAQGHDIGRLPELLEMVRFPLVNFAELDADERAALRFANDRAREPLHRLIGEAASLQIQVAAGVKRGPSQSGSEAESRRARKRQRGDGIPGLKADLLGQLLCGSLWADGGSPATAGA
uniref:BTB domain-containing protein n=1 Tax=Zooxanthella nutricula TaxID=1333877 RepID=A0A7S2IHZ7_9DINO